MLNFLYEIPLLSYYDTGFSPNESIIFGLIYCGALGLLTLFSLTFFLKNKEGIYLHYSLFVIFSLFIGIFNLSYDIDLAERSHKMGPTLSLLLEGVTLAAFSFYCFFNNLLLNVKEQNTRLNRFIIITAYATLAYLLLYILFYKVIAPYEGLFFLLSRAALMTVSIIAIIWIGIKVYSPIKVFFNVGSFLYFLGAFVASVVQLYPHLPFDFIYQFRSTMYFEMGILLETFCFGLALSYRVNILHQIEQKHEEHLRIQAEYEKSIAQAEMLATRMQVNPHFVFNSLNAIYLLIQKKENKKASQYLITLSRFFRMILELPKSQTISLKEELKLIEYYIALEAKRFEDNFDFHIVPLSEKELDTVRIPPLLLQPFIENAIWHGLLPSPKARKTLKLNMVKQENNIQILIDDNGVGRNNTSSNLDLNSPKKKSMGTEITRERIRQFNRIYDCSIHLSIFDKVEETGKKSGTQVMLTIKNCLSFQ